jgi:hypothetical protein
MIPSPHQADHEIRQEEHESCKISIFGRSHTLAAHKNPKNPPTGPRQSALTDNSQQMRIRCQSAVEWAEIKVREGDYSGALGSFRAAMEYAGDIEAGEERDCMMAVSYMGIIASHGTLHELEEALRASSEMIDFARDACNRLIEMQALLCRGRVFRRCGKMHAAILAFKVGPA